MEQTHAPFQPSLRDENAFCSYPGVETPGYSQCVPLGRNALHLPNGL